MKQLKHTLFITEENVKLFLNNGAAVAETEERGQLRFPLHNLDMIVSFSFSPATSDLMEECVKRGIAFYALGRSGKMRFRVEGPTHGNTFLRISQYGLKDSPGAFQLAKEMIGAKIKNEIGLVRSFLYNHAEHSDKLAGNIQCMNACFDKVSKCTDATSLRAVEALAARTYFDSFNTLVLNTDERMRFESRTRRPPENCFNALLSMAYSLLSCLTTSALESAGLDPSLGIIHSVRPGRPALSLDLMEEMRPVIADQFVLTLVNKKEISASHFAQKEDGSLRLTKEGLSVFFSAWNKMCRREVFVSAYGENIPLGLLPFAQAKLLAKSICDGTENYSPYIREV